MARTKGATARPNGDSEQPLARTGTVAYDPYLWLALKVIHRATIDRDKEFFHSDTYIFWLDYIQVCLPGELHGTPLPKRLRR